MTERPPASTPVVVLVTVALTLLALGLLCCAGNSNVQAFVSGFLRG